MFRHTFDDDTSVFPDIKLDTHQNQLKKNQRIEIVSHFEDDTKDYYSRNNNQTSINNQTNNTKRKSFTLFFKIKIHKIDNGCIELCVMTQKKMDYIEGLPEYAYFIYTWYVNNNTYIISDMKSKYSKLILPDMDHFKDHIQVINDYLFMYPPSLG